MASENCKRCGNWHKNNYKFFPNPPAIFARNGMQVVAFAICPYTKEPILATRKPPEVEEPQAEIESLVEDATIEDLKEL